MPFLINAYLPSTKEEVSIKELCYKQYRELVKSLYSANKKETILQYNSILLDLCPDIKSRDITFEDKLSLLLTLRNYCISPDLKLSIKEASGKSFTQNIVVESLIQSIKTIDKSGNINIGNIKVSFSSYKVKDEYVFIGNNNDITVILASSIDTLQIGRKKVEFKDLTLDERLKIVTQLPYFISDKIYKAIMTKEDEYNLQDFLVVKDPLTDEIVLRISKNITFEVMQKAIEYLFTEDLGNIYRAFYNMVNYAGFDANYVDTITPVEMQVYWMYFMQDREESSSNSNRTQGAALPQSTLNTELGF